jgi:glutamate synthase domain-containing protein 2
MNIQEIATKAVTGDKVAQTVWASFGTSDIIAIMQEELEIKLANGDKPFGLK